MELVESFDRVASFFELLGEPRYDASTATGAYCWARREIFLAAWYELQGEVLKADYDLYRGELTARARGGDVKAAEALSGAAGVRMPDAGYSLGWAVDAVDVPGVRRLALTADDPGIRSSAERLFAWVDEFKSHSDPASFLVDDPRPSGIECVYPPPEEKAVQAGEGSVPLEEVRAMTLEEVEGLTPEQLREIDLEAAFDDGFLVMPPDIESAWTEKLAVRLAEVMRDLCCYRLTVSELVEGIARLFEYSQFFAGNENDPSTPVGAFCWAFHEVGRSMSAYINEYFDRTFFELFRDELIARAGMGYAGAEAALQGIPSGPPIVEYPFVDALAAVDDPGLRGMAFSADDPVLRGLVGDFYALVDEHRRRPDPSPHAFEGDWLPHYAPETMADRYAQYLTEDHPRRTEAEIEAREDIFRQCYDPLDS